MKYVTLLLALVLTLAAAPAQAAPPPAGGDGPVLLQGSVTVDGNLIRLGDLFTGAGARADTAIAYSPVPGKRAVFDARWLYRVARAYGLAWRPLSARDQAVVERRSTTISRAEIEERIREALVDSGLDRDTQVELSNPMLRLHVAGDGDATLVVEDIVYENRGRRFTAILIAGAEGAEPRRVRVTGRAHRFTEIPVLSRRLLAGDIITSDDVVWIKVRADQVQRDIVADVETLVGKSVKRGMKPGRAIRAAEIRRPILVPKGDLVTLVFRMRGIALTARGRALQNGGKGDVVRVSNSQSHTVVEGVVTGPGTVSVRSANHLAMN